MNINPSSLFQAHFSKKKRVDINAPLHVLLTDVIPKEYEAEKYGTIWQSTGLKSSVEVLLIQNLKKENASIRDKLKRYFNRSWSEVSV